ncbi:MAG: ABC transporter substrate-binding protein [Gemmatimonadetes bacterium]|nr:MAG: ABC transporter substrate-binding protein [Gemmatimonadota bacterium]
MEILFFRETFFPTPIKRLRMKRHVILIRRIVIVLAISLLATLIQEVAARYLPQSSLAKGIVGGTPKELQKFAIRTAEHIAPPDQETPAEEGGYGFEAIAASMGYVTYDFTEEELKFFGDPRAVKGGVLTEITSRFPATMRTEGQNSNYVENSTFQGLLYESLLDLHPVSLEYIPSLATHWKIADDKMQFWFRINPDARWSDGQPVTAEDVVASWELLTDETILAPSTNTYYLRYERPVAESKYIVSVRPKELGWRNFMGFGLMTIYPAHYIGDLSGADYLEEYQFKVLPGTGPYTILEEDIKSQQSYTLTRRLDYWNADNPTKKYLYNFDRIKFLVVKDNVSLEFEKFKKMEQDVITVSQARRWVEETDFPAVKKGWVQKRKVYSEKPSGTSGYAFNMRVWPFNDKRIRWAFTYLFNRRKMNEEMYYNEYGFQNSLFEGSIYANPNNEKVEYNPEKAVQLLREAGFKKRNADGILVNEEGRPLSVEIAIPKTIDYMVTPYQQMLREYGIDLQIKFMDGNSIWKMKMERNFTITYESWSSSIFPYPRSYHSEMADRDNTSNIYGFKNARVDSIIEAYDREFDLQKRIELIREFDGIVADTRVSAWATHRPYQRLMFWNKFGYPEYMVSRYGGDYRSVYSYWWYDPEKVHRLYEAIENDTPLEIGELEVRYWPEYLAQQHQAN